MLKAFGKAAAVLLCLTGLSLAGQTPPAPPVGLEAPWDVRKIVADVQHDTEQLQPLLAQMNPQAWVDKKGAPSTYVVQWQMAQQQLKDVSVTNKLFAQKTDSLSLGLDTYFRLEALEVVERSLNEGTRQYDVRATADKMAGLIAHNFDNRQKLREYLRNLAASMEEDFKIADEEAQRCRTSLSKQPATNANGTKRR